MRNMSFSATLEAFRAKEKTVTRRDGSKYLRRGHIVMACEKCMGLKKGEKIVRIWPIRILSNKRERIKEILNYPDDEMAKEGFPEMTKEEFIEFYCQLNKRRPESFCSRIEFEHVPDYIEQKQLKLKFK